MGQEVLGVDIGGVIIDRVNDGTDTSFFGDKYLDTAAVPNAIAALKVLATGRFAGRVHLVSKAGTRTQQRTREWLIHRNFHEVARIPADQVHFCRERHEKAPICQKLGITHFIDDRLEVLGHLIGIVPFLYLFQPHEQDLRRFRHHLDKVRTISSWDELGTLLAR
jgi:hypothetical protein